MKQIMVVDDDVAILEVVRLVLEDEGFEVATDTGERAVELVRRHQPHLLLLDIWMRGLDGRILSQQLKTDPATAITPIVLMSAHTDAGASVGPALADDFLEKPFNLDDLLDLVGRLAR